MRDRANWAVTSRRSRDHSPKTADDDGCTTRVRRVGSSQTAPIVELPMFGFDLSNGLACGIPELATLVKVFDDGSQHWHGGRRGWPDAAQYMGSTQTAILACGLVRQKV